jgi:Branched-chain amino acid transport protein (AzlD)
MSAQWMAVLTTSLLCFAIKFIGHSIPETLLAKPRIDRITTLIPIVLLSSLIAMQTLTEKTVRVFDHRIAGIVFALLALRAKAPLPIIVIGAMVTSAIFYRVRI